MKRILKFLLLVPVILYFLYACVYHRITHMDKNDLEWVTNRYVGETMCFNSSKEIKATAVVTDVKIYNSLNPINTNYNVSDEYIALAYIQYRLTNEEDTISGSFFVEKLYNDAPVYISCGLGQRWAEKVPQKITKLQIGNAEINDIVEFDSHNYGLAGDDGLVNPIVSFAWSKKYGLVKYTFKDGTTYTRIDIE